jgi:hypothetical protein
MMDCLRLCDEEECEKKIGDDDADDDDEGLIGRDDQR